MISWLRHQLLGPDQEDSHLSAGYCAGGAEVAAATAAGDTFHAQLLDPGSRKGAGRNIQKDEAVAAGGA